MRNYFIKFHYIFFSVLFVFSVGQFFVGCSKSSTQPEPQRPQIEVTEDITEDTVWESGKDLVYS